MLEPTHLTFLLYSTGQVFLVRVFGRGAVGCVISGSPRSSPTLRRIRQDNLRCGPKDRPERERVFRQAHVGRLIRPMTEQRRVSRIEYRRMPDRKILDADPRRDLVMHDPIGHASKHRQKYNGNPLHTDLAARSDTAIVKQPPSHHFDVHPQPLPRWSSQPWHPARLTVNRELFHGGRDHLNQSATVGRTSKLLPNVKLERRRYLLRCVLWPEAP